MGKPDPVEQDIMQARIDELLHQVHVLERQKLKAAYVASHEEVEEEDEPGEALPIGAG